jgi:hypothetical protein
MPHKKKKSTKHKRPWMTVVMAEFRKNKKGGLKAAMKRAKKKRRR